MKLSRVILAKLKSLLLVRRVKGKSMTPTIAPKSIVIASSWRKAKNDSIVIFEKDGMEYIKRLIKDDSGISLIGDNIYDSMNFHNASDISIKATVVWSGK